MAALCLTTSSLSFNSAPQNMRIDTGKIKLKVKCVKQNNFTFILRYSSPYPCTFFPISLYLSHIPRLLTPYPCTLPHIPVPYDAYVAWKNIYISHLQPFHLSSPYPCTFPISLDFSPHIPALFPISLDFSPHISVLFPHIPRLLTPYPWTHKKTTY